jgi:threonine aldolase
MVDLRSDTVTKPTPGMLEAMLDAEVGDDVFGQDPTVNALQDKAARLFGKEAGLFCPSGTMTNQIAISVLTHPGDEVICHQSSHVYNYEGGGIARNSLCSTKLIRNEEAVMHPDEVEAAINDDKDWLARTSLVVAEDTSNRGGGKCYDPLLLRDLGRICKTHGLSFHLDGARAFNALVKTGCDFHEYAAPFDSISICLSKGLGAPVGSVLLGSSEFIREARRRRKSMGGGMRQAGYLAAAGIYALDHHIERLKDDHTLALILSDFLLTCEAVRHVIQPETNIVIFDVDAPAAHYLDRLEAEGILAVPFGPKRIRMVTHLDVDRKTIENLEAPLKRALR